MSEPYFAGIERIPYAGPEGAEPLAYHWYDADRVVLGKTMRDHLRIAVCWWHTFCWPGSDVFGAGTFNRPWLQGPMDATNAAANANPTQRRRPPLP